MYTNIDLKLQNKSNGLTHCKIGVRVYTFDTCCILYCSNRTEQNISLFRHSSNIILIFDIKENE